ncbi:MAG: HEAT repeat domain-containing protein [Deltaproteobacteria bacterium]|nr:HEAT repeat domain-containing protein [Deltaproteobacteria bacterium]
MSIGTPIYAQHLLISLLSIAAISCFSERDLPPLPDDLEKRNAALAEVEFQFSALEDAGAARAVSLLEHADYRVRARAARRIGELGGTASDATPVLIKKLTDKDRKVRIETANALGYIGDERAIDPLIKTMMDTDRKVRRWASKAIGRIGEPAIRRMVEHFSSKSPFHTLTYKDEVDTSHSIREVLRKRLATLGKAALPHLIKGVEHENRHVQSQCIMTLGDIGPDAKESIPVLLETLEGNDPRLKKHTAWALGKIGDLDPGVVPALTKASKDRDKKVAKEAKASLKSIKKAIEKKNKKNKKKKKDMRKKKKKKKDKSKPQSVNKKRESRQSTSPASDTASKPSS